MMKDQGWKKTIGNLHRSAAAFIKWVMLGSAVGSIVGVMGVLFHFSVEWATEMRQQHSWLLFLLPLGGVVIALLYRQTGMEKDMGTNTILEAVRGEHPLRLRHPYEHFQQPALDVSREHPRRHGPQIRLAVQFVQQRLLGGRQVVNVTFERVHPMPCRAPPC